MFFHQRFACKQKDFLLIRLYRIRWDATERKKSNKMVRSDFIVGTYEPWVGSLYKGAYMMFFSLIESPIETTK